MKILLASAEVAPFAKVGGLADVVGALPKELVSKGADARVILPKYGAIPHDYVARMTYLTSIYVQLGWRNQYCGVFSLVHEGVTFYFVDNEFYFGGDYVYGGGEYELEKYAFFAKAVLSLLKVIDFRPDVIHANDWHTGMIPVLLNAYFQNDPFYHGIKTVFTIHNLAFQGIFPIGAVQEMLGLDDSFFTADKLEYYGNCNFLKGGLVYSDIITTVSPTYRNEIQDPYFGEGMEGLLKARDNAFYGITNGIDYVEYNPRTDDYIAHNYGKIRVYDAKPMNKCDLQAQVGLPVDGGKFTVGMVSRLTDQKGLCLLEFVMEELCGMDLQLIVLGTGEERYENMFRHYRYLHGDKVSASIRFDNALAHKIYAGCDAFLMPSRFEPCGLSQLIAMRYGTLPIVRETGGLKDTVSPYNQFTGEGTGFSFAYFNAHDMLHTIAYAQSVYYNNREAWNHLIYNAMCANFSWDASADNYLYLYDKLTGA